MKKVKDTKKYAKQFLKSVEMAEVPKALEQLNAVASLIEKDKNFKTLMVSPVFTEAEREKAIAIISHHMKMSSEVAQYLIYLSNRMLLFNLKEIINAINSLYMLMQKKVKAVVATPTEITKEYEKELAKALAQLTGKDVELEFIFDPSLLGGVRIQVGSTMYDSSIKGQLGLLKDKLIKG
ncbi:MAG: ATP synthase F1 subunit delta [Thermodesulfovibrionales bacterium]|nr:ATP synthase F1 subunit delta [Thermodesulfovibrionales bacterium]